MTDAVPTPLARLLLHKGLLQQRLQLLGVPAAMADRAFAGGGQHVSRLDAEVVERLHRHGLVEAMSDTTASRRWLSLLGIQAVNLELTYRCNMACSHCLQQSLRPSWSGIELRVEVARKVVEEAWFAGFCERGLNLTGGEPLLLGETVFDMVALARSLGIQVRLNSNSWWGTQSNFRVGGQQFSSPRHLVRHLKELGLTMFAFSFDNRFKQMPSAFDGLVGSASACEHEGMPYQLVCTGQDLAQINRLLLKLGATTGKSLRCMIPVAMQMVDLGGAASASSDHSGTARDLAMLALQSPCHGKGFYRPALLHIDPAGGVRSCLYALGLQNMGNLNESSLTEIINRFPNNPVSQTFSRHELPRASLELFRPEVWKPFSHPCTASVVLARLIDAASRSAELRGRLPTRQGLLGINHTIARELNLARCAESTVHQCNQSREGMGSH